MIRFLLQRHFGDVDLNAQSPRATITPSASATISSSRSSASRFSILAITPAFEPLERMMSLSVRTSSGERTKLRLTKSTPALAAQMACL